MPDMLREDWIVEFIRLMAETAPPPASESLRPLAEERWPIASHRSPANAVQDILIERYLEVGHPLPLGVDLGDSAA